MSIKFENTVTPSPEQWKSVIIGMRNPHNSWDKSDSRWEPQFHTESGPMSAAFVIGPNDLDLMNRLRHSGTDHRKFMRMLPVMVTITAPLYWWKEFDTYKIATVSNSCSTMHKIHAKEFTLEDFSTEHLTDIFALDNATSPVNVMEHTIFCLNFHRDLYLKEKDKRYWWQMIQLLPSSYNQKRTVMMNYEVLANIYKSRKDHRLDEWREFCKWIEGLPYSEIITRKECEV